MGFSFECAGWHVGCAFGFAHRTRCDPRVALSARRRNVGRSKHSMCSHLAPRPGTAIRRDDIGQRRVTTDSSGSNARPPTFTTPAPEEVPEVFFFAASVSNTRTTAAFAASRDAPASTSARTVWSTPSSAGSSTCALGWRATNAGGAAPSDAGASQQKCGASALGKLATGAPLARRRSARPSSSRWLVSRATEHRGLGSLGDFNVPSLEPRFPRPPAAGAAPPPRAGGEACAPPRPRAGAAGAPGNRAVVTVLGGAIRER